MDKIANSTSTPEAFLAEVSLNMASISFAKALTFSSSTSSCSYKSDLLAAIATTKINKS